MTGREIGHTDNIGVYADPDKAEIALIARPEGTVYELNITEAAYLAVLLDEAIEAVKGRSVKLDREG
jgi:inosine-uridine nucleoside N-ribohydrolase